MYCEHKRNEDSSKKQVIKPTGNAVDLQSVTSFADMVAAKVGHAYGVDQNGTTPKY